MAVLVVNIRCKGSLILFSVAYYQCQPAIAVGIVNCCLIVSVSRLRM